MGRPPKLTPHQRREALRRRNRGTETLGASALTRIDPGLLNGIDPLTEYPPCIVW